MKFSLVLLTVSLVSGTPLMDSTHLVQRKVELNKPSNSSEQVVRKSLTCESVQFTWYAAAAHLYASNAQVWGTNVQVVSEGMAYGIVFHPGSNVVRIPGVYDRVYMDFSPRIGAWAMFSLLMHISGQHTLTIQARDHNNNSLYQWSLDVPIPNWYEGYAEDVRFYARRGEYPNKEYYVLSYGNLFGWRSTEGTHWIFFTSSYTCSETLIDRGELAPTIVNSFQFCAGWGDPHVKGFGIVPTVDFMGIGTYTQAKSVARSMEVHTYQCPYAAGTSIQVGFAVRSGPHTISFISGITRINGTIYTDGVYPLSVGTNVEVTDNWVEILGPTTLTGYGRVWGRAWIRPDSPTGFISRTAVSMPLASTQYAEGLCASTPEFIEVPDNESLFSADELLELSTVCQPPDNWEEATNIDSEAVCGACPETTWISPPATLYSTGHDLCSLWLDDHDQIEACVMDYCVACGDSTVAMMTADAAASLNNVINTPSNLDDIVEAAQVSPNIAMAYCMLWGGGRVLTFEDERYLAPEDVGHVTEVVDSSADDLQVQVLNCNIANHTVGAAPVAVAVRVGSNLIVARGINVTVNGTGYDFGHHDLSGSVTMEIQYGMISITGAPRIMGVPTVLIRTFGHFHEGNRDHDGWNASTEAIGFGGTTSVTVRLPATNAGYSTGICREQGQFGSGAEEIRAEDWYWPDVVTHDDHVLGDPSHHGSDPFSGILPKHQDRKHPSHDRKHPRKVSKLKGVDKSRSLFKDNHDLPCGHLESAEIEEVAEDAGTDADTVTAEMICNFCADHGWANITLQNAYDNCSAVLNTSFYDGCVDDYCKSCGNEHVQLAQASLDAYVRHLEDGVGAGTWPAGLSVLTTPAEAVRILGDPHARNVRGEAFDIHATGWVQLIRIPREAEPRRADLLVTAELLPITNSSCAPTFIHKLSINGSQLGGKPLVVKMGPHGTPQVVSSRSGFTERKRGPRRELVKGDVTLATFNNSAYPATKGVMHVTVGKYNLVVRQRTLKNKRLEFFDVDVQGIFEEADKDVGGLLGLDSHGAEAQVPKHCAQAAGAALHRREGQQKTEWEEEGVVFNSRMLSTLELF